MGCVRRFLSALLVTSVLRIYVQLHEGVTRHNHALVDRRVTTPTYLQTTHTRARQTPKNGLFVHAQQQHANSSAVAASSNTHESTVAFLIAGQCHRFIYRDQSGPLFQRNGTRSSSSSNSSNSNSYKIDVYIALQCGKVARPHVGRVDSPPYIETVNLTDITEWYLNRGANSVSIQIIDTTAMDETFDEIAHQATSAVEHRDEFNVADVPAWHAELRKFYLRHVVFAMSQSERDYDVYVFNREDNYYLAPLDLHQVYFDKNHNNSSNDEPFVIVNAMCEFGGAYSDKMYIANHLGAALIFSSTKAEFMSSMKRFLTVGLFRHVHDVSMAYQAESFVHDTLNSVHVERIDMRRVDVRYNSGIKCVPSQYFTCMSDETKALAYTHDLVVCESLRKLLRRVGQSYILVALRAVWRRMVSLVGRLI